MKWDGLTTKFDGLKTDMKSEDSELIGLGIPVVKVKSSDCKGDILMQKKEWDDNG